VRSAFVVVHPRRPSVVVRRCLLSFVVVVRRYGRQGVVDLLVIDSQSLPRASVSGCWNVPYSLLFFQALSLGWLFFAVILGCLLFWHARSRCDLPIRSDPWSGCFGQFVVLSPGWLFWAVCGSVAGVAVLGCLWRVPARTVRNTTAIDMFTTIKRVTIRSNGGGSPRRLGL
jgi:hypothetical protein